MKITFWGAAKTVTGSMHEVGVNGKRYLLDCGLYQGRRAEAAERNKQFPFAPSSIDGVILSHAHIDHSGNLPTLVKKGYGGPIYTTPATADLCGAMLLDSAHLQEKDAAYLNKRHHRRKELDAGLGNGEVEPLVHGRGRRERCQTVRAGSPAHAEGSGPSAQLRSLRCGAHPGVQRAGAARRGNWQEDPAGVFGRCGTSQPVHHPDPDSMPPVDYLIMESTYGDRLHKDVTAVADKLAEIVNRTCQRGGKIIVPAFAVGRTQQLVLLLHELFDQQRIPRIPIFVDSPLAIEVTKIFRKHTECFDDETREFLLKGEDPFGFNSLRYVQEASDSKALNDLRGPFIIISASGMCEGGRILHHLKNNIEDPRNTVLVTGFMAEHTLGRKLVDKLPEVPIFGEPLRLRAEVAKLNELSGHADQHELLAWLKPMAKELKKIFLVHGEPAQSAALAVVIKQQFGVECVIPERGETVELS